MSEEVKTFNFDTGSNGLLAAILPALQNRGIDTGMLMGMMNNRSNGFLGGNGGFQDIIALIVIAAIFGNGNGGGLFGGGGNSNNAERELLASMIQRNGVDLGQLASCLNCSVGKIDAAIGQVATQICNLAGQQGMGFQQVINAIQAGNCNLAGQIANCCCDLKGVINNVAVGQERGFSSLAFETQKQTCSIEKSIADSTEKILAGQRAAEMREMQDKLDSLREKNAQQAVFLNNAQQTAQFQAMLAPIAEDLAGIKCRMPKTEVVNVQPEYVPINRGINVGYVPTGYCGGWNTFGGWNGWNGGCNTFNWG